MFGECPNPPVSERQVYMAAKRSIKIDLRLTQEEAQRLNGDVAKTGLSREAYLRALIENRPVKAKPAPDLVEVLRHLQQINHNMNQIAVKANTLRFVDTQAYWENVRQLKATISTLLEVMYGSWPPHPCGG